MKLPSTSTPQSKALAKKGLEITPAKTVAGIKIPATKPVVCLKCQLFIAQVIEDQTVKCPQCQANHAWIRPSTMRKMRRQVDLDASKVVVPISRYRQEGEL